MRTKNDAEIGARVAQIRGDRSRPVFAREMGVHKNTLVRYETGQTSINGDFLASLVAAGYNANWVLSGRGEMMLSTAYELSGDVQPDYVGEDGVVYQVKLLAERGVIPPGSVDLEELTDKDLLAGVLEGLDMLIEEEGRPMQYGMKAELLTVLYDYYRVRENEEITPQESAKVVSIFNHLRRKRGKDEGTGPKKGDGEKAL